MLDGISEVAENYVKLYKENGDYSIYFDKIRSFNILQMVYFCQQVVSHFESASAPSMCLTILTNKLNNPVYDEDEVPLGNMPNWDEQETQIRSDHEYEDLINMEFGVGRPVALQD